MMRLVQITISILALSISTASAIECSKAPDRTPGPFWRYRIIDGTQCWYRGETVLAKADLNWPQSAAVNPVRIDEPPVQQVAPVFVRTITYRPPEQQIASGGRVIANGRVIASAVIVIGFGIVIAGMFWPMRRRREGAPNQLDFLSFLDTRQAYACKLNQWLVASSV
jgi:hypothetical protein